MDDSSKSRAVNCKGSSYKFIPSVSLSTEEEKKKWDAKWYPNGNAIDSKTLKKLFGGRKNCKDDETKKAQQAKENLYWERHPEQPFQFNASGRNTFLKNHNVLDFKPSPDSIHFEGAKLKSHVTDTLSKSLSWAKRIIDGRMKRTQNNMRNAKRKLTMRDSMSVAETQEAVLKAAVLRYVHDCLLLAGMIP